MGRPANHPDDPVDFLAHLSRDTQRDLVPLAVAAKLGLTTGIMPAMTKTGTDAWRIAGQTFSFVQIQTAAQEAQP